MNRTRRHQSSGGRQNRMRHTVRLRRSWRASGGAIPVSLIISTSTTVLSFLIKYFGTFIHWAEMSNRRIDEYNTLARLKAHLFSKSVSKDPAKDPAKDPVKAPPGPVKKG